MLVYRIELGVSLLDDEKRMTNIGPYVTHSIPDDIEYWLDLHNISPRVYITRDDSRHPAPWDDKRLMKNLENYRDFHFGFTSLPKLSKWFNKHDRSHLHYRGFVCMVYETDTVYAGSKQCVFPLAKATPIKMIPLVEIY